jgi:hypothetical protein
MAIHQAERALEATDETLDPQIDRPGVLIGSPVIPLSFDIVAPQVPTELTSISDEDGDRLLRFGTAAQTLLRQADPDFVSISDLPGNDPGYPMRDNTGLYFDMFKLIPEHDLVKLAPVFETGDAQVNIQTYIGHQARAAITTLDRPDAIHILQRRRDEGSIDQYGILLQNNSRFDMLQAANLIETADFILTPSLGSTVSRHLSHYAALSRMMAKNSLYAPLIPSISAYTSSPEDIVKDAKSFIEVGAPALHFLTGNNVEPFIEAARELRAA